MSTRKTILGIALVTIILGLVYGFYEYNRGEASMEKLTTDLSTTAVQLMKAYQEDETTADTRFVGKILEIKGELKEVVEKNEVQILFLEADDAMGSIQCEMQVNAVGIESLVGQTILVKGLCDGYLMDVILSDCIIL